MVLILWILLKKLVRDFLQIFNYFIINFNLLRNRLSSIRRKNMRIQFLKISFFLLLSIIIFSCSLDDVSDISFEHELNPIVRVKTPDSLSVSEHYNFSVEYENTADCYVFIGFYVEEGEQPQERIITALSTVTDPAKNCRLYEFPRVENASLEFIANREDFYILKFWQGWDEKGNPIYLERRIEIK